MAKKGGWSEAFNFAKSKLAGVNLNDPNQISNLLKKEGWQNGMTDKLKKWGTPILSGAKIAKMAGIDPLGKLGIDINKINPDEIVNTVGNLTNSKQPQTQQYSSYDRRNNSAYQGSFIGKSNNLPD